MNLETMRGAPVSVSEELASQILSEHPLLGRAIEGREEHRQIVLQISIDH
jgi:hypothetical protein